MSCLIVFIQLSEYPMDSQEWKTIKKIFSETIEQPVSQQAQFLKNACKGNIELEKRITEMLSAESTHGKKDLFDEAVSSQVSSILNKQFGIEIGSRVGSYKIEALIGQGGMGKVFLGNRVDESFKQKVAIKVIDGQNINQESIQRFELERQILANFDHPNIARLIDGGTTKNGMPYIVMEYVEGETITEYCQSNNKTIEERLHLFSQVGHAINYAHQNLVIHRDIKPSNILVTASGEIKLLDFGIAKLQAKDEEKNLEITQEQQRIFTPSNASPEQLIGQPITTRTDVYELGALLYHLLTDQSLFCSDSKIRTNLEKAIIEKTPQKPSNIVKLSLMSDPHSLSFSDKKIKVDLDTITLKALKKDPQRRYQSAKELVEDIERFVRDFPIQARTDSVFYQVQKFMTRNKALSASLMASIMAIIVFVLVISYQNFEIKKQKQIAVQEALVANHVVEFMIEIFDSANPDSHQGDVQSAEDLLQTASESLEDLTQSKAIKDRLSITIGRSFQKMGKFKRALPLLEEAIDRENSGSEKDRRALAKNLYRLGDLYAELIEDDKAIVALEESIAIYTKLFADYQKAEDEIEMSFPLVSLGSIFSILGKFEDAKQLDLQALEITIRHLGEEHFQVGEIYSSLGHVHRNLGEYEAALEALNKGLSIVRKVQGEESLQSAHSLNQLASTLFQLKRYREGLSLAKQALVIRERIHQEPHPEIAASLGMVANLLVKLGKHEEAVSYRKKSIDILKSIFGDEHAYIGISFSSLAGIMFEKNDLKKAKDFYQKSLIILRKVMPKGNFNIATPLIGLGKILNKKGEFEQAKIFLEEGYQTSKNGLPAGHKHIAIGAEHLADALVRLGEYSKANQYLKEAESILTNIYGESDERVIKIKSKLEKLLLSRNKER